MGSQPVRKMAEELGKRLWVELKGRAEDLKAARDLKTASRGPFPLFEAFKEGPEQVREALRPRVAALQKKLNRGLLSYENFIGIGEVKSAQNHVLQVKTVFYRFPQ